LPATWHLLPIRDRRHMGAAFSGDSRGNWYLASQSVSCCPAVPGRARFRPTATGTMWRSHPPRTPRSHPPHPLRRQHVRAVGNGISATSLSW